MTGVHIKSIALLAEEIKLYLQNGDSITGILVKEESTEQSSVIIHPQLGKLVLDNSHLLPTNVNNNWNSSFELGIDGSNTGSIGSKGYSIQGMTHFKDQFKELDFAASYDYESLLDSNGHESTGVKRATTKIRYDRILSSRWSTYLSKDYDYNALNKVGINSIKSSFGFSYKFIDTASLAFRVSSGPLFEWLGGGIDCFKDNNCGNIMTGTLLRSELNWSINDQISLGIDNIFSNTFSSELFPSNSLVTTLKFYPSKLSGWYTSINYENFYSSIKEPSNEHAYKINIGTDF